MNLRTKLILSFVSITSLILVVGLIFYLQLKNLIEPLTPQSIPRSVDQLENAINKTNLIFRLQYQVSTVENNLKNYVNTNDNASLQDYFMNQAILDQLINRVKNTNVTLWSTIALQFSLIEDEWSHVISAMQQNNITEASRLLTNSQYLNSIQNFNEILNTYYQHYNVITNETSVVTVKLASKNTEALLLNSIHKTIIIFFDALLLSLILAYLWAETISRPIKILSTDMKRLSTENLDITIHINPTKYSGEIKILTSAFLLLINKLRTTTVSRDKLLEEIERRKLTEDNLRHITMQLAESNRELDQFAYTASHDLRAPLQGIELLSQWIIEESHSLLPEKSRHHLDLLKKRVRRLDELISGILAYSRIKTSGGNLEEVDLNKMLDEIIDNLNAPKNIKITIDEIMPTLTTDKIALTQVFLNLISNAIKFHDKPHGHINIGYQAEDHFFIFYVKDDGPGIEEKFHEKIFELFKTLQSRDQTEGTGIGLAIVKKIVEKHEGKITVQSIVGKGSTFYFSWPIQP